MLVYYYYLMLDSCLLKKLEIQNDNIINFFPNYQGHSSEGLVKVTLVLIIN